MSTLFAVTLVVHVLTGILAIAAFYIVLMQLLKRMPQWASAQKYAWAACVLLVMSWATAAYYYVEHYGAKVKPRILAGDMPAAHSFFMEAKEHVFLLLPFLAISIALSVGYLAHNENEALKKRAAQLTAIAFAIGLFAVLSGILISGSI